MCLQTGKEENLVAIQFTRLDALVGPIWPQKPGRYLNGILVLGPPWKAKTLSVTAASGRAQAGVHFPCSLLMPRLSEVIPAAQLEGKPSPAVTCSGDIMDMPNQASFLGTLNPVN